MTRLFQTHNLNITQHITFCRLCEPKSIQINRFACYIEFLFTRLVLQSNCVFSLGNDILTLKFD